MKKFAPINRMSPTTQRLPPVAPPPEPAPKPEWQPAQTITVPMIAVLCPLCGSPKTVIRSTLPERAVEHRRCNKCGAKFAHRILTNQVRCAETARPAPENR